MKKLGCYIRVSTDKQADTSIPMQEEYAKKKAADLKMEAVMYVEQGKSASSENLRERQQLMRLLSDLKSGELDAVYALDHTRFSRNKVVSAQASQVIAESGKKIYYHNASGGFDLSQPTDRLTHEMVAAYSVYDTDMRLLRFEIGRTIASRRGKFLGPNPPYGYKKMTAKDNEKKVGHLKPIPEEAKIYRQMVKWYLDGFGTYQIAQMLNARGIPTKSSSEKKVKKWNAGTIRGMLQNKLYHGKRKYGEEYVVCPAIISVADYKKVMKRFKSNRIHKKRRHSVHKYLLSGLIKCGVCGRNYFGKIKENRGERLYCCLSNRVGYDKCENKNINIDRLDRYVMMRLFNAQGVEEALKRLVEPEFSKEEIKEQIASLNKALKQRQEELKSLISIFATKASKSEEIASTYENLITEKEKQIDQLNSEINSMEVKLNSFNDVNWSIVKEKFIRQGRFHFNSFDEQKEFVRSLIDEVVIMRHFRTIQRHMVTIFFKNDLFDPQTVFLSSKQFGLRGEVSIELPDAKGTPYVKDSEIAKFWRKLESVVDSKADHND